MEILLDPQKITTDQEYKIENNQNLFVFNKKN